MRKWCVYLRGRLVTEVYYDSDCCADYVYRSLTQHDGYPVGIMLLGEARNART